MVSQAVFAVLGSQPFVPILNSGIGGVPILGFRDYKKIVGASEIDF